MAKAITSAYFPLSALTVEEDLYQAMLDESRKLGTFGRPGRQPGEFRNLHNIAIDSKGNLYTAEAGFGRRVQRFVLR